MLIKNNKKVKLSWILVATILFIILGILKKVGLLELFYYLLTIVAILLYSNQTTLSVGLFAIGNMAILKAIQPSNDLRPVIQAASNILIIGTIGQLAIMAVTIFKGKYKLGVGFKTKLIRIITFESVPKSLKPLFKVIIYSLFVTISMGFADGMTVLGRKDATMLTSIYITSPIFYTISTALAISDMYVFRYINIGVMLILNYMQISIGHPDYISLLINIILLITLIISNIDYRRIQKVKQK